MGATHIAQGEGGHPAYFRVRMRERRDQGRDSRLTNRAEGTGGCKSEPGDSGIVQNCGEFRDRSGDPEFSEGRYCIEPEVRVRTPECPGKTGFIPPLSHHLKPGPGQEAACKYVHRPPESLCRTFSRGRAWACRTTRPPTPGTVDAAHYHLYTPPKGKIMAEVAWGERPATGADPGRER